MRSPSLIALKKCFSLQLGAKMVGFSYLIFGIAGIVLSVMSFSNENSLDNTTIANNSDDTTDSGSEPMAWRTIGHHDVLLIVQLVVSFLTVLFAIFVLIAAWMINTRGLLWPWLIFYPLFAFIGFLPTLHYAVSYWRDQDIAMGIGYFVASLCIAVIGFICWWVIFKYYQELSRPKVDKNNQNSLGDYSEISPQSEY